MVTIRNDTLKHYKSQLPSETMYVSVIVLTKRFQEEKLTLDNTYESCRQVLFGSNDYGEKQSLTKGPNKPVSQGTRWSRWFLQCLALPLYNPIQYQQDDSTTNSQ